MSSRPPDSDAREYFHHVMEQWKLREAEGHPYAANASWHTKYAALQRWIRDRRLSGARVLEVGCGTGLLQDLVPRYIGIDIAVTSSQFMHKPFCVSTATSLPFADDSFDAAWSIWVLEHVPRPDLMLAEMRRVVKPGGSVFVCAGYAVAGWVSQGIHLRPWVDLTWRQRLTKLTIPVRTSKAFKIAAQGVLRLADLIRLRLSQRPVTLRYGILQPNYRMYWDYDADACVSLDAYNVALYFLSRGDRSEFGHGLISGLWLRSDPQAYTVRK